MHVDPEEMETQVSDEPLLQRETPRSDHPTGRLSVESARAGTPHSSTSLDVGESQGQPADSSSNGGEGIRVRCPKHYYEDSDQICKECDEEFF